MTFIGGLVIAARPYDHPDVARMVEEVQAEYVVRYGSPDEAVVDPADFAPPVGLFLVGSLDADPVATGGWRRVDDDPDIAEIKRMYVAVRARRRGVAQAVLAELERTARDAGVRRLILNTGTQQPEAIALYEREGYSPIPGFGFYAGYPDALFYGRSIEQPFTG